MHHVSQYFGFAVEFGNYLPQTYTLLTYLKGACLEPSIVSDPDAQLPFTTYRVFFETREAFDRFIAFADSL